VHGDPWFFIGGGEVGRLAMKEEKAMERSRRRWRSARLAEWRAQGGEVVLLNSGGTMKEAVGGVRRGVVTLE